jgi:putative transposase
MPNRFISNFDSIKKKYKKIYDKLNKKNINLSIEEFKKKIQYIGDKYENELNNHDSIIRSYKYLLDFNDEQKNILDKWFLECDKVYNKCVNLYNNTDNFNLNYKKSKLDVFNMIYGKNKKNAPYDILTDEVRIFCSNIKSCLTNLSNNNIEKFIINERKTRTQYSICISKNAITNKGFYTTLLGEIKDFSQHIDASKIVCDCRLIYNKNNKQYYLSIPQYKKLDEPIKNRNPFIALDPGEKNFMTFYTLNQYGQLGINMRKPILDLRNKISKFQRILAKNINEDNKKIKNKNKLKKKIQKKYRKIRNIVKELHNQIALNICKKFERIILPKFETQKMISNKGERIKKIQENVEKIRSENITEEEKIKKIKEYRKRRKLNKKTKYVLNALSHYKFKQHILNKAEEYGCQVIIVTEEYTSKTCGLCGMMSEKYNYREKECEHCHHKIDRDVNGARNIFLKNHKTVITK